MPIEIAQLDTIIDRWGGRPSFLIEMLQDIQEEEFYKYLPDYSLTHLSRKLVVPLSQIYHIATFYSSFNLEPRGKYQINVCLGTACHVKGATRILEAIERDLKIKPGETDSDLHFTLNSVRCLGCCGLAPIMTVNEDLYGSIAVPRVPRILRKYREESVIRIPDADRAIPVSQTALVQAAATA